MDPKTLKRYRLEFPILQKKTYLNTCSLGALSKRSISAMNEFFDLWSELGASAWYEIWLGELATLRASFASLIGAKPQEIAILPSVSVALSSVATAIDYSRRDRVLTTELDFPTVAYQWLVKRRQGVRVEFLASEDRIHVPLEAYEQSIDEKTALVATSRVFFTSGYIQDIQAITEIARSQGAYMLVDDYQATGQVPLDVKEMGIDFLVTGGLKWLLGGPGIAFLYVRQDLISKLEPMVTGWFAARNQFEFNPKEFEYRQDAARFEFGTPALAAVYAARAGLEIVHEVGAESLRKRTSLLTSHLIDQARQRGMTLRVTEREEDRAGIVMLPMDNPARVVKELAQRDFIVDYRPGAVRVSPYFYNTTDENEALLDEIEEILSVAKPSFK